MPRWRLGLLAAAVLLAAVPTVLRHDGAPVPGARAAPPQAGHPAPVPPLTGGGVNPTTPNRPSSNVPLSNGVLRSTVDAYLRNRALAPDLGVETPSVRVEVIHNLRPSDVGALITSLGGIVEGSAGRMVQASVPVDQLVALEHTPGVEYVRPPLKANEPVAAQPEDTQLRAIGAAPSLVPVTGEEVAKTNAAAWQSAGYTGAGVKVGIVDVFDQTVWTNAQNAGEVPAPAGTFCQVGGAGCNVFTIAPLAQHGTAVAEIIHEMAPGAQFYLATVETTADLQAAVNYFAAQGVRIVSRSLTSEYDGPGNGTGPMADVINSAVAQGMTWFNAAGNQASDGVYTPFGGYWRGAWADANNNGWLDFAPGDEFLGFLCPFMNGLRWSDWGSNRTDYDLYIYSSLNPLTLAYTSTDDQTAGAPPLESNELACDENVYYASIRLASAGSGTAGDTLEFGVNGCCVEYWQNPYSAAGPASDSASSGEVSVGAIDPPTGTTIAPYSSQGPTNDSRVKPDVSAASCVASYTYAPSCFNGTSAATPAVAGAAALILDAGLAATPAQVGSYLLNSATVDRGAAGTDNVYGRGEVILPPPPPPDTDGDGCYDAKEPLLVPPTDPNDAWDFYNVPVPALFAAPDPTAVLKDHAVAASDAQAVFAYFKSGAKAGTTVYDGDLNMNETADGVEYDRTFVGPGQTGPPDGKIAASDAQLAFAQFKFSYAC